MDSDSLSNVQLEERIRNLEQNIVTIIHQEIDQRFSQQNHEQIVNPSEEQ